MLYRLRDDLKAQAAELVTLQTRLKDSQSNFNEYQTSTLPTQYELTKTLHEKDRFAEQVRYLEEELQKKTREERALRAESGDAIHQLEQALSQANGQLEDAAKQLAALKVLLCCVFICVLCDIVLICDVVRQAVHFIMNW